MRPVFFILMLLLTGTTLLGQRSSLKVSESTNNDQYRLTVRASDNYADDLRAAFLEVAGPAFGEKTGKILRYEAEEGLLVQLDVRRNRLSIEQTEDSPATLAKARAWGKVVKGRMKKDAPTPPTTPQ